MDHPIKGRWPDLGFMTWKANVSTKEFDNFSEYKDLDIEITIIKNSNKTVIPIIIQTQGIIKNIDTHHKKMPRNPSPR